MILSGLFEGKVFEWVLLPAFIFCARLCDVTFGTLRQVFISKGLRSIVPIVGFFEVLIWLISIKQIMQHLDNPMCYIAFAAGYATGTYVGLGVERRLALGLQILRVIIPVVESKPLIDAMQKENMGTTIVDAHGAKGPVKIIFTVIKRKDIELVQTLVNKYYPQAFYSIEDIRIANQGVFPGGAQAPVAMDYVRRIFPFASQK